MSVSKQEKSIWSGVYDQFNQVPKGSAIFDSSLWTEKQRVRALTALEHMQSGYAIPEGAKSRDYPLPAFLAALLPVRKKISVLDYGGAMGQTYLDILGKIPGAADSMSYFILETQSVVDAIPDKIRALPGLTFLTGIDEIESPIDIVHCGSVLQYIEDWQSFFMKIIEGLSPDTFVLSDLLVGAIPSFVTAQQYYDRVTPVKCINIEEFYQFWSQTSYALTFRTHYYPLAGEDYFPTHDLPPTHRIKTASHLIFSKKI